MRKGKVDLSPEQVICNALRTGMTKQAAAHLAGISDHTYYEWVREDPAFAQACQQARAEFLSSALKVMKAHPSTLHKLVMQLRRDDPELQPLVEKVENTGDVTIRVVRDGTDPRHPPTSPPP